MRQTGPESGPGIQVKQLKILKVFPSRTATDVRADVRSIMVSSVLSRNTWNPPKRENGVLTMDVHFEITGSYYPYGRGQGELTYPPGHLWRDKWTALSGPLSLSRDDLAGERAEAQPVERR